MRRATVEDVKWLARSESFDLDVLQRRYEDELRSYLAGPVERHDLTLKLWIDLVEEEHHLRPRARVGLRMPPA